MSPEAIRAALLAVHIVSKARPGSKLIIPPALIDLAVAAVMTALNEERKAA
jgi:hypothetical protein